MSLQIVIKRELARKDAEKFGPHVRVMTGHTIIPSPGIGEELEDLLYQLRGEPVFVRLAHWETGGAHSRSGVSQIVCGPEGKAITPVKVEQKGQLALGRHALFVGRDLVTVMCEQMRRDVSVIATRRWVDDDLLPHRREVVVAEAEFLVRPESDQDPLVNTEEFDTWFGSLPPTARHLYRPIYRAVEKSLCYHCRAPHYISGKTERPEGMCEKAADRCASGAENSAPAEAAQVGHA